MTTDYPAPATAPVEQAPAVVSKGHPGEFAQGMAGGQSSNDGPPRTSASFRGSSVLDAYMPSPDGMASGPTGSDRRLVGLDAQAGELPTPNGSAMGTYTARLSQDQFRSA